MEFGAFWKLLSRLEEKEGIIPETSLIENGLFFKRIKRTFSSDSILYGNDPYIFLLQNAVLLAPNVGSYDGKTTGLRLINLISLKEPDELETIATMYHERLKQVKLLRSLKNHPKENLSYEELENKFLANKLYNLDDLDKKKIPYIIPDDPIRQMYSVFFPLRDGVATLRLTTRLFYSAFIQKLTKQQLNELQDQAAIYEEEMNTLDYVLQKNKVRGFFAKLKACN